MLILLPFRMVQSLISRLLQTVRQALLFPKTSEQVSEVPARVQAHTSIPETKLQAVSTDLLLLLTVLIRQQSML